MKNIFILILSLLSCLVSAQNNQQLDIDFGIPLIYLKLGTPSDSIRKIYHLVEADHKKVGHGDSLCIYRVTSFPRRVSDGSSFVKTIYDPVPFLNEVKINWGFSLTYFNDKLYKIVLGFNEQQGCYDTIFNLLMKQYGKRPLITNDGYDHTIWETSKVRLIFYKQTKAKDAASIEIFAKCFEPIPKQIEPKPIREFWVSKTSQRIPKDMVWEIPYLSINGSSVIKQVAIYDTTNDIMPTPYSYVSDCKCKLILKNVKDISKSVIEEMGYTTMIITQLPIRFGEGVTIQTNTSNTRLKIREWRKSDWNEKYPYRSCK